MTKKEQSGAFDLRLADKNRDQQNDGTQLGLRLTNGEDNGYQASFIGLL